MILSLKLEDGCRIVWSEFFGQILCQIFFQNSIFSGAKMLFWPTWFKFAGPRYLKIAAIFFLSWPPSTFLFTHQLWASSGIIILPIFFANLISIVIQNAFIFFTNWKIMLKNWSFSQLFERMLFVICAATSGLILISPWILTIKKC